MARVRDSDNKRVFYANGCEINKKYMFPSNYLSTTKYNLLTFLPFSLFMQFRRVANIYFLITAILQSISYISPLHPFSAIAPLVFVLSVSMIREAIEDYLRYRSDKEVNSTITMIYKNGTFTQVRYQDIEVGHIVLVKKDQVFPCDLVMLSNSNENTIAYIETSTIDGEKNLKTRQALTPTSNVINPDSVIRMFSLLECDEPNQRIYQFVGTIDYMDKKYSLDKNNLLLAGALLRNTHWAIGVATYTGTQTKLRMNLMSRMSKQSKIERIVNKYIVYIISFQLLLCLACAILYGYWSKSSYTDNYYLGSPLYDAFLDGFLTYFTYFLLLNTMLPISLIISLELLKLAQGYFMQKDLNVYSTLKDRPCKVSSFSLNEELGMVEHIFTDKTGTLTCNKMQFKYCSVGDKVYGENTQTINTSYYAPTLPSHNHLDPNNLSKSISYKDPYKGQKPQNTTNSISKDKLDFDNKDIQNDFWSTSSVKLSFSIPNLTTQKDILEYFLKCMALCHECLIEEPSDPKINPSTNPNISSSPLFAYTTYIGQSPDEITLVDSAMRIGVKYAKFSAGIIDLEIAQGGDFYTNKYERICIFEFDSDRKRNSVVVREIATDRYFLFIKGADNIMTKLLAKSCDEYLEKVSRDLLGFSEKGLRTLILGFKVIDPEEFSVFKAHYDEASTSVDQREEKIKKVAEMVECNIVLLGCTAVEDSLQAEVPETIQDIRNAGIAIWMLTGDKLETAMNIGKTCSLLNESMIIEKCPSGDYDSTLNILKNSLLKIQAASESQESGLVIEGAALDLILNPPNSQDSIQEILEIFLKLSVLCKTVICCRVTPGQKKDVVKLIKLNRKCVTLAIGDGANDVSMILEAQVGIGLYGEEGMQAVQASDYAIGEFKYLWELLFIHGRFNYIRQSEMILYFIYKNLVFTLPQFYYAFYCTYSGQTVYDDWYITTYNMILTALPLLVKGLFEKDIKIPSRSQVLESGSEPMQRIRSKVPFVYVTGRQNMIFTRFAFVSWVVFGVFHSAIIFFIPLYAGKRSLINSQGHELDYTCFSITSFSCIILVVNLKLSITTRLWNIYHLISILLLSIFLYLGFILIYDMMALSLFGDSILVVLSNYYFYLCVFVAMSWVLVFDGAWFIFKRIIVPKSSEILMEESVRDDSAENRALNSSNN
ncbi:hypothetical protein SteCoe_4657 [Stentor coeruleus]|uniref:Phospholipid-transporting ATPase n=1 Tax=Stentor coeruleus TaxID=5963 RepID=A0A1R2CU42_9CILI|nr:hypothetical protein SteCoe_4657 [Stentor coeruleus]